LRIGIFDSGLGGLILTHAFAQRLPSLDLVYLGDTARVPYGDRSQEAIYRFTHAAVDKLFRQFDCALIILACNTASAEALRKLQQEYLPTNFPDRRILGVIIPSVEAVDDVGPIGILGTRSTVRSGSFPRELARLGKTAKVVQQTAPLLVPLIENNALEFAPPIVERYVSPLREAGVRQVLLGCTHYGLAAPLISDALPGVKVISQEAVVPERLENYLQRHPEISDRLSSGGDRRYLLTDVLDHYVDLAEALTGDRLSFEELYLPV
jgi:glutamate racemase